MTFDPQHSPATPSNAAHPPPTIANAAVDSAANEALHTQAAWHSPFAQLGSDFVVSQAPTPLPAPYWVVRSHALAQQLDLPPEWGTSAPWLHALTGNLPLAHGGPHASVYSGHQFGVWAGQLGDGRALLLGQVHGQEIQLKGAGPTPFSRMGDGRAVLRSSIREFLCSEAMHALGVPSTRALCVTGSDAPVRRESVETAAVLARTAPSFLRFGHFEHFSHSGQHTALKTLADFTIDQHYPDCRQAAQPYRALLSAVTQRTAELLAHWQSVGFCHGVMNTDNMSILGLTLDYGPFQFLDAYNPQHICNHSDQQGRYAFYKQPQVAYWNLFCLGQALLPLLESPETTVGALEVFKTAYPQALAQRMSAKLGLLQPQETDAALIENLLRLLASEQVDFTIFWRRLSHWVRNCDPQDPSLRDLFLNPEPLNTWLQTYAQRLSAQNLADTSARMLRTNPKYVLRNYLGELAIRDAQAKNFETTAQLLHVLEHPFDEHPEHQVWADFPPDWSAHIAISCSS